MKARHLLLMVVAALVVMPSIAGAGTVNLTHDDSVFETSIPLSKPAIPGGPPGAPVPAVQFDAPATGVYALDSVSFHLLQRPAWSPNADGSPGMPGPQPVAEPSPQTYHVTVHTWAKNPSGADWVPRPSLNVDLAVEKPGSYVISMAPLVVTFAGSIRVGISLRQDAPLPEVPVQLGVDSDGGPLHLFGNSYGHLPGAVPTMSQWLPVAAANYGIRASVHAVPAFACRGFLPPFDSAMTMKAGGRTIPLKATLHDDSGGPVTSDLLIARPVVQLLYSGAGEAPVVAPAGRSSSGETFRQDAGSGWIYNLKTAGDLPPGTYSVVMKSGDVTEYAIDPTCVGTFAIGGAK